MIKSIKIFSILLMVISFVSCENESTNDPTGISEELVNIHGVFNESGITDWTIDNDLNTQKDTDNTYQINTFNNGKMVMVEYYYNDGTIFRTDSFEYDINDRIVNNIVTDLTSNETIVRTYEYVGFNILATSSDYDSDDNLIEQTTWSFTLNANNQIVRYENSDGTDYWDATYTNGNLTEFVSNDNNGFTHTTTFTYSTDLVSQPYQLESYRYGPEWRNNMMLTETGVFAFKKLTENGVGSNFLTGYTYTQFNDSSGPYTITLDVTYEFDNLGRLSKQTKNKIIDNNFPLTLVLTYEYQ